MQEFIQAYTGHFAELSSELQKLNNIPKVRLVGGNIGAGAYGPAWRRWEDTRVVSMEIGDDPAFIARGFEYHDSLIVEDEDVYKRVIDQLGDAVKMLRTEPTAAASSSQLGMLPRLMKLCFLRVTLSSSLSATTTSMADLVIWCVFCIKEATTRHRKAYEHRSIRSTDAPDGEDHQSSCCEVDSQHR